MIAQEFFTEDVARVLAFGGSQHLTQANDTLRGVVEQLGSRRVADHARVALARPLTKDFKLLTYEDVSPDARDAELVEVKADPDAATAMLQQVLVEDSAQAADTLGHIDYRAAVEHLGETLHEQGDTAAAEKAVEAGCETLKDRGVLDSVVKEMSQTAAALGKSKNGRKRSTKKTK